MFANPAPFSLAGVLDRAPALFAAVTVLGAFAAPTPARAETLADAVITEFLASNGNGLEDEDGDRSDWIEIWNASGVAGDLDGWFLTDDPANLTKWRLPAVEMGSGGYLVVFASGKDRAEPSGELHTNFRLQTEGGGFLALVKPDGTTVASEFAAYPKQFEDIAYGSGFEDATPVTFVAAGDSAKWLVPSGPVPGWTETAFDDSSWSNASTGIGFDFGSTYDALFGEGGDIEEAMRGVNATVYIRIPFEVPDPTGIQNLTLRLKWEDGFVAHLNGTEFHRERAPANPVWDSSSEPTSGRNETDAQTFFEYPIDQGGLVAGTNVLAIQGLNAGSSSSDLLIVPELTGIFQDAGTLVDGFFTEPSPGAENGARLDGIVGDTRFSVDRGFYEQPFQVEITTSTEGAEIRYTTDGTPPSESRGTVYAGPVTIDETTVLRAIAYKAGFRPTNIDTHTYVFPADVVTQSTMRTSITQDPVFGPQMVDALKSVPSISLSMEQPNSLNTEIERPLSIEMIFPDGTKGFQENAGVTHFGGYYTNFAKKNFRIYFRREFGATKLRFPLFDGFEYEKIPPVEEFDTINLRTGSHDMEARGAYMSNRFTDDTMLEMGNLAPHGRFVHVYLNGTYWGQYHLRERWGASMAASYLGGEKEDYEAINALNKGSEFAITIGDQMEVYDGTGQYWREAQNLINGPSPFTNAASHVDIANVIDFMLLWTSGNAESEFRSVGSVPLGVPYKFFIKDGDGFLRPSSYSVLHNGPMNAMSRLRAERDPDYLMLVADRIHKHFFNDGVLTVERNRERLRKRVDEARLGFLAEAARWNYRTPQSWESYQQNLLNNHFRTLTDTMISRFRSANMYPDLIAPVFSQHGGSVAPGAGITMSTNATAIYYTLDGSDPRVSGGGIRPEALRATFSDDIPEPTDFVATGATWKFLDDGSDQGTAWRAPGFDDGAWASGPSELGYGERDEATEIGFIDTDPEMPGDQRNATTYFRHAVTIPDPGSFSYFVLKIKYDDAAAVYLNGTEIARTSNLPANAAFDTFATGSNFNENTYFEYQIPTSQVADGENVLAVEIHQATAGSSDVSFDLFFRGEVDTTSGDNVTLPVTIPGPVVLNARAYDVSTGEWSALNSAFFSVGSIPADAASLAISEVHYHPAEPVDPAEVAVSTDRDDYEFVELLNRGAQPIDLTGVGFVAGITFTFPENTILDPGRRLVVVRNLEAFTVRYGDLQEGVVAGTYSGRLSNDGERIAVNSGTLGSLVDFTYNDQVPWPTLADGAGYSMVLAGAAGGADASDAANWRPHAVIGGAPGAADSTQASPYLLWKNANNVGDDDEDKDGDHLTALAEYAMGTSPQVADAAGLPAGSVVEDGGAEYLAITFRRSLAATDIAFEVQFSTDLETWMGGDAVVQVSEVANPGGETATVTWRSTFPRVPGTRQFLRVAMRLVE